MRWYNGGIALNRLNLIIAGALVVATIAAAYWYFQMLGASGFLVYDSFYLVLRDEAIADDRLYPDFSNTTRRVVNLASVPVWGIAAGWMAFSTYLLVRFNRPT